VGERAGAQRKRGGERVFAEVRADGLDRLAADGSRARRPAAAGTAGANGPRGPPCASLS
jgi:hypothetical protein